MTFKLLFIFSLLLSSAFTKELSKGPEVLEPEETDGVSNPENVVSVSAKDKINLSDLLCEKLEIEVDNNSENTENNMSVSGK